VRPPDGNNNDTGRLPRTASSSRENAGAQQNVSKENDASKTYLARTEARIATANKEESQR
jgi:hypothetical protein